MLKNILKKDRKTNLAGQKNAICPSLNSRGGEEDSFYQLVLDNQKSTLNLREGPFYPNHLASMQR